MKPGIGDCGTRFLGVLRGIGPWDDIQHAREFPHGGVGQPGRRSGWNCEGCQICAQSVDGVWVKAGNNLANTISVVSNWVRSASVLSRSYVCVSCRLGESEH